MSSTRETVPSSIEAGAESAQELDERLTYRSVFQRMLIRPEIGASIGLIAIWIFFWASSVPFGTANATTSILDVAATLGIMAVAVSMLMIGGEFDLSTGAMTGAMGILIIMLVKEVGELGGAGLSLFVAIPLSLAVALGVGFFNGWMVERTLLPSFIVTLGTFFILKGAKLGFSKLIVDQIQVGRIDEGAGYSFWRPIFAAEWDRTNHQYDGRDVIFTTCVLIGATLVTFAVYELFFARRLTKRSSGLIALAVGVAGVYGGIGVLHVTDNISGNVLAAVIIAVSTTVAVVGLGAWRYEPIADRGEVVVPARVLRPLIGALAAAALAMAAAAVLDSSNSSSLFFPFTEQGLRATLFIFFGVASLSLFILAGINARQVSVASKTIVSFVLVATVVVMAFFVRGQSTSVKFRAEGFTVMLIVALGIFSWAIASLFFEERSALDRNADRTGMRVAIMGIVLMTVGWVVKLLFTTNEEIGRGISGSKFSMRIIWFLGFTAVMVWVLGRTRFGSWTFAVGGNKEAARQVGVPAARTKTRLFMLTAGAAWLVGMLLAFRLNTIQASTGDGQEFEYIIAAVVGGTLLTGGYGTALGGALGAIIMSMSQLGIPFSRWNSDWRFLFLGAILLTAVIANRFIRTKAEGLRR
jgi:ribose/xylose/arabinose/galactoside ABC-type transport system permease subunit